MAATVHPLPPPAPSSAADTPQPCSLDAEASVLGAMLLSAAAAAEVRALIGAEDFHRGAHRTLFEAVCRLLDRCGAADPVTLADELDRVGHLAAVGGPVAVSDLAARVPSAASAGHYARIVADKARRRALIDAGSRLVRAAADAPDADAAAAEAVTAVLDAVRRTGAEGVVRASTVAPQVRRLARGGAAERGLRCGWAGLDTLYRPLPGQLTVLTGVPSHGKSSWLDAYLVRMADRHGWRSLFFSPERRRADHAGRLAALVADRPLPGMDPAALDFALSLVDGWFRWVDDDAAATVGSLTAVARAEAQAGLDAFAVDPWNWVEPNKPRDVTTAEHIGRSLAELMRLAQTCQLHVFVVAHPVKMRQLDAGPRKGAYQVPRPYDIAESAGWMNRPDWVLCVWRDHLRPAQGQPGYDPDRDPAIVDVHVQKARHDDCGRVGVAALRFTPGVRGYTDVAVQGVL